MEPRKITPRPSAEASRIRECSFFHNAARRAATSVALNWPCRANPLIVPQPPTKTPKCRQKTDNWRKIASSYPFGEEFAIFRQFSVFCRHFGGFVGGWGLISGFLLHGQLSATELASRLSSLWEYGRF